ncbi:MAG: hypothetical protein HN577_19090, partial [Rhodospirillaceae bacterium]|nr:hypothetical protein [Rhodospirillaceae bacterium]
MSEANINLVAGCIGIGILGAFLIGLAVSIGSIPFALIVALVLSLAATECYQSTMTAKRKERDE